MKIGNFLKNRPKSVRVVAFYSLSMIALLSILQIVYIAKIVPIYLEQLSNIDPFSSLDTLGNTSDKLNNFYKFINGFSSGLVATIVEAAFISMFRLNKPYRRRSYINAFFTSILSAILALTYFIAIIIGRQPVNYENIGTILVFILLLPMFFYLPRKIIKEWTKSIEPEFPKVNLDK